MRELFFSIQQILLENLAKFRQIIFLSRMMRTLRVSLYNKFMLKSGKYEVLLKSNVTSSTTWGVKVGVQVEVLKMSFLYLQS